jgi:hypothetical protein
VEATRASTTGTADAQSTVEEAYWAWSDRSWVSTLHRRGVGLISRLPVGADRKQRLTRSWREAIHRGSDVECPVCHAQYRHFQARWNAVNTICWRCGSQERHRTLSIFLDSMRPALLSDLDGLLHFAPEPGLEDVLRPRVPGYTSCDLVPGRADLAIDITDIDLPDESFDGLICAHVLEHVPDDAKAMSELRRVLRPGGWAIVMVPVDHSRSSTLEDPSITDPVQRRIHFWQEDHVRLYALDIVDRLEAAGFDVEHCRPTEELDPELVERYRLGLGNDIFLCRKPAG